MIQMVRARAELRAARAEAAGTVALVPTMGALHAGHRALLDAARAANDHVFVSIFVNPLQFAPGEDLDRYPRTLDADLELCREAGVDVVWVPAVEDVYRGGQVQVSLSAGPLAHVLEGAIRPGHFDGMLTVVAKLLNIVAPNRAYFGEKDYQQLTLVRRLVLDLDLDVDIEAVPTVRDPDGLALSSRNRFLSDDERRLALTLSRALRAGRDAAPGRVLVDARDALAGLDVDYLELRAPDLGPAPPSGPARLLVAAHIGTTRLIDNLEVIL